MESTTAPEDEGGNPEDFDCGHFSIDTSQWGMIFGAGQAVKCDRTNGHFTLNLIIYIGGMPKVENVPKTHIITVAIVCYFPSNSPRWRGQSGPPTPYEGRSVAVLGRLAGFELGPAKNGWAARPHKFFVEIQHITFLAGNPSSPSPDAASITTVPNTLDSPTTTVVNKKNTASAAARKGLKKGSAPSVDTPAGGQLAEPSRKANSTTTAKTKSNKARSTRSQATAAPSNAEDVPSEDVPLSAKAKGKRPQTEAELLDIEGDGDGAEAEVMEIDDDPDFVPAPASKRPKLRL